MSKLSDRLRAIVATTPGSSPPRIAGVVGADLASAPGEGPRQARPLQKLKRVHGANLESALGGAWQDDVFVVERRVAPETVYGRVRVGEVACCLRDGADMGPVLAGGAPARAPFTFFDLETTGLSGGAGTQAFLVGCGGFGEDGAFVTRQFLMTAYGDERPMLDMVAAELARAGSLVSFNGKSFDAPVIETRYLFHRLEWAGARLPHLDVLHPSRAFWGARSDGHATMGRDKLGPYTDGRSPCSLVNLEWQQLGARRVGDVPGMEIPARYFQFVRSGDARPLAAVLEHNRLDLLSLAGLAARLLTMVREGAEATRNAREALALGRIYERAGLDTRARDAYERAVETAGQCSTTLIDALRALAYASRRARRYDAAADYWRRVLGVVACPQPIAREAAEALAIHHEHRVRDLAEARRFALQSLEHGSQPARVEAGQHRLARIERKMERGRGELGPYMLPD